MLSSNASVLCFLSIVLQFEGWNVHGFPFYFQDLSIPDAEAPLPQGGQNTNKISPNMMSEIIDLLDKMRDPFETLIRELTGM